MTQLIDIGINIMNKQFQNEQEKIIERALNSNIKKIIVTGVSIKNSIDSAAFASKYNNKVYSTAGIHPHESKSMDNQSIEKLKFLLNQDHVIAIGECGLDFDRDFSPRNIQEICFEKQLALSLEIHKPLFLHERNAFKRFIEITSPYKSNLPNGVIHCFTGTKKEAKHYLDLGFYLGFTGAICNFNRFPHLKEIVQFTPLDRIMIETDAPFMIPKNIDYKQIQRNNSKRNEPAFLNYIALMIANFKNLSIEEVAKITTENSELFFKI